MNKLVLVLLLLLSQLSVVWGAEKDLTSRDVKVILEKNKSVFLLDVRTQQEYSQGKLGGSVLIPLGELERRIGDVPRNKTIVVYCAVGSRSKAAAGFLSKSGYKDVFNMSDGIVGWYRNGFPVQR
jgi:rhodanese-related sulfurtransferase